MRKSFTRLLSIVMLFSLTLLSAVSFGASPTVSGYSPTLGFSNYDGTSGKLIATLTFNQNVVPGAAHAGIIGLYYSGGQVDPIQINGMTSTNPLTGSTVVISNNVVTITFNSTATAPMQQGQTYNITVSPDAIMNSGGEYFAGLTNTAYSVTIGDYTDPTVKVASSVMQFTPRDNSIAAPLAGDLNVQFTEAIAFGAGVTNFANFALYSEAGDIVEVFGIDPASPTTTPAAGKVSISGDKLYFNPTSNLTELAKYYVRISASAITDASVNANPYAGINNNSTWSFQAADVTAPTVTFVPVNATTNVQQGQIMKITFHDNRDGKVPDAFEIRKDAIKTKFSIGANVSSLVTFTENGGAPAGSWTAKYTAVNEITFTWGTGANDKFVDHAVYVIGVKANSFFDEEANSAAATTSTFTAGDFLAPVMTPVAFAAGSNNPSALVNGTPGDLETTKLFLQSTNTDASGNDVEVHYLILASGAATPTPTQVMAGPLLSNVTGSTNIARGFASVDAAGTTLASKTTYDVYFAAKDHATVPNTSTQADVTASKISVQTSDIVSPVPTAKVNTLTANNVTVTSGAASLTSVKMDSPVTITFDETVTAATANITVKYWNAALATPAWVTLSDGPDYTFGFAANTITITGAHADIGTYAGALWKSSAQYQVIIDNNEIGDVITGTGTVNYIAQKVYSFTIEDYTGPVAVFNGTTSNNITGVATAANIVVDLGEACTRADGTAIDNNNVFFRDVATGNIVPSTVTVSGGRYITIDPTSDLQDGNAGHNYSIELTSTLIDAAGNPLGYYKGGTVLIGSATPQMLTFTTGDEEQPVLTFVPADGTSGLNNNANGLVINVTINETVKKANGDLLTASDANYLRSVVSVVKVSDNSSIDFDITSNTATSFDVDLTRFLSAYAAGESYKVTVNGLYDAAGNAITSNSTTYSIREYTKPTISAYSPADGTTLVAAGTAMKITFSEPVVGVAGKLITLTRDDVAGAWTFDAVTATSIASNVVTLVPASSTPAFGGFAELGQYHITFPAGAFVDLVGNATDATITSATAWNWSAFDNTNPVLATLTPVDDATPAVAPIAKPSSLVMTFTEASGKMYAGPGSIYVRETGNTGIPDLTIPAQSSAVSIVNNTVTISVNSSLFGYGKDYWVEVDANAFRDASNNYYAGLVANSTLWNFQIQADPKPYYVIAQSSPTDDANDVDLDATVTIKFSEPVWITSPTGKYLTIRNASDGTAHSTVYFDAATVSWGWNLAHDAITIQHPDFLADHSYYINVTTGTFADAAGQFIDPLGVAPGDLDNTSKLNFTTTDLTAPVVSSITVNGTNVSSSLVTTPTGIAKDGKIYVAFSEPVTIAAPNSSVILNAGAITYTATFTNDTLKITPSANLASGITVTVEAVANAIVDKATTPNPLSVVNTTIGKFTVLDYVNPTWDLVPTSANVTAGNNKFDIANISIDEAGKIYYYAVPKGTFSTTPSPSAVRSNATGSKSVTAATSTVTITGLNGDAAYDLYFIAEDVVPNLMNGTAPQQVVSILNVSTLDNVAPLLLTSYNTAPFTAGLSPADGNGCVATSTTLKLKFDEAVNVADATRFWVRKASDHHSVAIASVASGATDVVTITLTAALAEVTDYYVEIDPQAIQDIAGNYWGDYFYGVSRWNFTTADETAPTIASRVPANGAANIALEASNPIVIKFSEAIAKNTTANVFIDVYRTGTTSPQERINVLSDAVSVSGEYATIERSNIFASEVSYYVVIPNNAFYDLACSPNNFAGVTANTWVFTTKDVTSPVVSWTPANNATQQSTTTTTILAKFVDPRQTEINVATTYETLYKNGTKITNGTDLKAYFSATKDGAAATVTSAIYTDPNAGTEGDEYVTIKLNGSTTLASDATYVINYNQASAITDESGNVVASSTTTFSTQDTQSPYITYTPANTTVDVLVGSKVNIKFDRVIYNSTAGLNYNLTPSATDLGTAAYITFREKVSTLAVAYSVEVVTPGLEYNLVPNASLKSTMQYEVIWNANAGSGQEVADAVSGTGITLSLTAAQRTTVFTTEDVVKPTVIGGGYAPANNSVLASPSTATVLTFSEKVIAGSGTIQIRRGNGQIFYEIPAASCTYKTSSAPWTVTIPHPTFEEFTSYYIIIPSGTFTDASTNKNVYDGITNNLGWTFSTDDGTDPQPTYTPTPGTSDVAVYSDLILHFDENIVVGAGNFVIYYNNGDPGNDGNVVEIIPIGSALVNITGSDVANNYTSDIITINPATTFDKLGTYYIRIDKGIVTDAATNDFDGISDNTTWSFTITDNTTPALLAVDPVLGATGVEADPTLTMTFNRDVLAGVGEIKLFKYDYVPENYAYEEKLVDPIDVNSSQVDISGPTVTITPTITLEDNTIYYVLIGSTVITNTAISHDQWAGISSPFVWRFTTGDNTAPTVSADLVDGTDSLANDFDVTLTFDEAVVGADETTITATGGTINGITETVTGVEYVVSVTADDLASVVLTVDGTIADASGNLLTETVFNYSVADNNGPTMTATPDMGTDLPSTFTVTLEFSEDVTGVADAVTVDGGDATVTEVSATEYTVEIVSTDGATVTLDVANTVVDAADNALVGTYSYTYNIVADGTAPEVSADPDSSEGMPNSFSVDVIFTEPVNDAATDIEVDGATSYTVVGVDGDAVYTVEIVADDLATVTITVPTTVTDIAGNALAADAVFTYTVADHAAPTVTTLSPANGANDLVAANAIDLVLTFNEDVVAGAGSVTVYLGSGVQVEYGIADAVVSGNTVTISMEADDLLHNQTYFVYVDNGFVTDEAGNAFAGITSPATWVFSTVLDTKTIELVSGSLKVYPNPCTSSVTVESTNGGIISRAVFTNVAGQIVKDIAVDGVSKTISTSNLRSGIYFVSLYDGKVIAKTERIVKR